jgi:CheY-like chemotaxis protein
MADAPHKGVRILVADADCALFGLLEEWLSGTGIELAGACGPDDAAHDGYDLILVDLPFPRQDGHQMVKSLAREHPGTPIIALSSTFLPGIEACGAVARELGVAGALPKPLTREALTACVGKALQSTA